jgi:hypothetical protein
LGVIKRVAVTARRDSVPPPNRYVPFTERCFPKKREKIDVAALWLLSVSAGIEAATGVVLIIFSPDNATTQKPYKTSLSWERTPDRKRGASGAATEEPERAERVV